jgi:hypothetical protein
MLLARDRESPAEMHLCFGHIRLWRHQREVAGYAGSVTTYVVTIEQNGANVVATGSGDIDSTGFPGPFASGSSAPSVIEPTVPYIYIGTGGWTAYGISITGPTNFPPYYNLSSFRLCL